MFGTLGKQMVNIRDNYSWYILEKEGSWQVSPHPGTSQHLSIPGQSPSALHSVLGQEVLGSLMIGQKPSLTGTDRAVEYSMQLLQIKLQTKQN